MVVTRPDLCLVRSGTPECRRIDGESGDDVVTTATGPVARVDLVGYFRLRNVAAAAAAIAW